MITCLSLRKMNWLAMSWCHRCSGIQMKSGTGWPCTPSPEMENFIGKYILLAFTGSHSLFLHFGAYPRPKTSLFRIGLIANPSLGGKLFLFAFEFNNKKWWKLVALAVTGLVRFDVWGIWVSGPIHQTWRKCQKLRQPTCFTSTLHFFHFVSNLRACSTTTCQFVEMLLR